MRYMGVRKCSLFLFSFLLITESVTPSPESMIDSTEWVELQKNGTVNICKGTLGKLWKNDTHKQLNESYEMFNVCVPKKQGFHEFVEVNDHDKKIEGYSIAIFCLALQELPYKIQHVFRPISNENYTDVVHKLQNKSTGCDAVAADVTITSNRTKYADFTMPYMGSEIYLLVPAIRRWNQTIVTLVRPFTVRLWISLFTASILTGGSIGFLEYRAKNLGFYHAPFYQKLFMIIWFPVSKFFFQEGRILNRCSKGVLVVWLITIFIVMQIFTACLSSWLTVNQLQPKVPKEYQVVGYQKTSFVVDFFNDKEHTWMVNKPIGLTSVEDYKDALDNGTVDAIFDEYPYIDIFLAKYGNNYVKVGPLADEPGLGFAFRRGSSLHQDFSNAVVKVTESRDMAHMKKKYKFKTPVITTDAADLSVPQSLDVHSFLFLFLFMGFSTVIAIIISEISLRRSTGENDNESREMHSANRSENSTENDEAALNN
ncbi:hypothetical protein SSX86_026292 [Deinandra increscens subsp. villosa]|uniref:Ionotropic glutamate receptor C-terminal domain-containing protein n=1 Tax=Deinandra increscens subsp. villosa TaxID=3103831 RepID=A0AAP0CEQ6_9ASTR